MLVGVTNFRRNSSVVSEQQQPRFYKFWLKSSGQTDAMVVRRYDSQPNGADLESDLESWAKSYGAWKIADHLSYGWEEIRGTKLPRNRKDCLKRYQKACDAFRKIEDEYRLLAGLLACAPFNSDSTK